MLGPAFFGTRNMLNIAGWMLIVAWDLGVWWIEIGKCSWGFNKREHEMDVKDKDLRHEREKKRDL